MKRSFVYGCWAPEGDPWRTWVKPVLFAALDAQVRAKPLPAPPTWLQRQLINPLVASPVMGSSVAPYRVSAGLRDTALVIDLPSAAGAELGVALSHHGFRPVPLYNAIQTPPGVVCMVALEEIKTVLVDGASVVGALPIGLPPAFLLDANRMARWRSPPPHTFDNRSVCSVADFPSAETMLRAGIRRVVIIRDEPASDLDECMFAWQRSGIAIWTVDGSGMSEARPSVVQRPSGLARLVGYFRRGGLMRHPDGSFGAMTPHAG